VASLRREAIAAAPERPPYGWNDKTLLRSSRTLDGARNRVAVMDVRRLARLSAGGLALCVLAEGAERPATAPAAGSPPPYVVAFTRQAPAGAASEIRVMRADGSDVRLLTSGTGLDIARAWSPDGTRVAFEAVDPSGINSSVEVVGIDGGPATEIDGGYAELPAWSPDGAWLAYQQQTDFGSMGARADTSFDLYAVRPDGSSSRDLGVGGTDGSSADWVGYGGGWDWSPDSRRIALVQPDPGHQDPESGEHASRLAVFDVASRRLLGHAGPLWDPDALVGWTWSPDGRRVALVVSESERDLRLMLLDAATGRVRTVANHLLPRTVRWQGVTTSLAEASVGWAWSPNGRWLAVVRRDSTGRDGAGRALLRLDVVDVATGRLWRLPGALPTRIVAGASLATEGAGWEWSPDGTRIAMLRARSAKPPELVVADVSGRSLRSGGSATTALWSPDGRRLAVTLAPPSTPCGGVSIVSALSGARRLLAPRTSTCDKIVDWSADGSFLLFERAARPFSVERDGSRLQRVATVAATAVVWPEDCSQALGYRGDWVLRDASGVPRLVKRPPLPDDIFAAWLC